MSPIKKYPDFIIIGVQKGGTSSLFHYLSQHPQLRGSKKKETHFFDDLYYKGVHWYKNHFSFIWDKRLNFEATPYYIFHPLAGLRMKKHLNKPRFIVLLRNPLDRAYSHYMLERQRGREKKSFAEAVNYERFRISEEEARLVEGSITTSRFHKNCSYVERGFYSKQIKKWLNLFDRKQFLFLKSEDLFNDPLKSLYEIYDFLDIKKHIPNDLSISNKGIYKKTNISEELPDDIINQLKKDNTQLNELVGFHFNI